jgi:cytochrome b
VPEAPRREPVPNGRVPVWDAAVRLLHWTLAAVVVFDFVHDDGDWLHRVIGYAGVGIVLTRLLWAVLTHGRGRMAMLRPSPHATLSYLRELAHGRIPRYIGHDPLGLWMVWLLWTLVLLLGVTGWMSRLDAFWGDDRVHDLHAWLADALMVAVALHLAGVAAMSWLWRENLPASILTGRKREIDRVD